MAAVQYKISFVPDNNYGCIVKKTNNRKEAYAIYREMKAQIGEIRPGQLCIFEVLDNGTERYLCRYKTGKDRNGKLLVQNLKNDAKKLYKVYNQDYLNGKVSEYSKMQSDLLHGLELINISKVDPCVFAQHVVEKQELITHLRRQYKNDLYDATSLKNDLKELSEVINKIQTKMTNLRQSRHFSENKLNPVQETYLESLGVDVGAYCHNANPNEVLPLSNLVKPFKEDTEQE